MLDKILNDQGIATPAVQSSANAVINAAATMVTNVAIPHWHDQHPVRQNMKRIQASLKVERIAQNMTQRDLAVKADMSQGSITRAEKNGWISITTLLRIANALGKEIILN
jgi:DNA-binding XRE family transcriptional regulator